MFFDQPAVKAIVSGRNGRVRGEDRPLADFPQRFVKRQPIIPHSLPDHFERHESAVAFIEMVDARRDSHGRQGANSTHAQHQFLAHASPLVAAIETARQFPVLGRVPLDVAIEQKQPHAAHNHLPDFGQQLAGTRGDGNGDGLAARR